MQKITPQMEFKTKHDMYRATNLHQHQYQTSTRQVPDQYHISTSPGSNLLAMPAPYLELWSSR